MSAKQKKEELIREMQQLTGHSFFMTRPQFCSYLGISANTAKAYLKGVASFNNRFYHIPDIAELIIAMSDITEDEDIADGR